jgi:hypothetical protein
MEEEKKVNKLEHPCFPQPEDGNIKVWRYMDLSKLIHTISQKSLYLCRTDLLGDTHEGSITKVSYRARKEALEKIGWNMDKISLQNKKTNKSLFINCWQMNNYESEAMWKLYCPDNKGVALQTTYKKLIDSISYDDNLFIGLVKYIDYETEWFPSGNVFYPVMHKRKAFEHEKEVRIIKPEYKYWKVDSEEPPFGIYCPWDLTNAIENIYVNPYSETFYYESVVDVLKKYGNSINPIWSPLKGTPYY